MTSTQRLPRSSSEAQGIASADVRAFVETLTRDVEHLHSLMLVRHGHVIAEGWWSPYEPRFPHTLFSLSKSFTSTAIGLVVAEGRLSVDDLVLHFFPDDAPAEISENLGAMRVRHLLSMSTGHHEDVTGTLFKEPDGNWIKAFLAQTVQHEPGTHFVYNSAATYMLSAIIQRLTGERMLEYLRPRLFMPLGIEQPTWETSPQGIDIGGWGLSITTEDIACFGQLYLQKGIWRGTRVVPEAWVEEATRKHVSNGSDPESDWAQGYGYQFWRCRHNTYRGDGAFGQYCVVMPEQGVVLAITAAVEDMQKVLNLAWQHLLPVLSSEPLPEDSAAHEQLHQALAELALPIVQGAPTSPAATHISGTMFVCEPNEQHIEAVRLKFDDDTCEVTLRNPHGEHRITSGGAWQRSETTYTPFGSPHIAACGAWTAEDTYTMQVCFVETAACPTISYQFTGNQLVMRTVMNVSFGAKEQPVIIGRRVKDS